MTGKGATSDPAWGDDGTGPDGFRVPWSIVHGYALVLVVTVVPVLVVAGVAALGVDLEAPVTAAAVTGQALLMTLAGVLAWLARTGRLSWRLLGPARPQGPRDLGRGLAWGTLVAGPVLAAGWLVRILQGESGPLPPLDADAATTPAIVATAVVAIVVAPLLVTVVHHGVLYQALRRRFPATVAIPLSAAGFALGVPGTISLSGLVRGVVLGAALAGLLERTRTTVVVLTAAATVGMLVLAVRVMES